MDTVLRVTAIYFFILIVIRILGKRQLSEMTPFDFIMLMLIPELVTQALNRDDYSLTNGIVGVSTLLSLVFLTSLITYRFKKAEKVIDGEPTILVRRGKLIAEALDREHVTPNDVLSEIHRVGLERLEEVKWAILESDGQITVIARSRAGQTDAVNPS